MNKRITLKNMLAEGFYYDVGTEKNQFESSVATATEQAKKKFEDSMKQKVLGQKVKIRASRGQPGQPEKDYVLEKVSSASIDWYWKQYVVVFKDEKNKEYFLKPGFKVEVLSAAGQPGQKQTQQTPQEPTKQATPPAQPPGGADKAAKPSTATAPQPAGAEKATRPPVAETDGHDAWKIQGSEPGEIYVLKDGDQVGGPFESEEEAKDWMYDKQQQLPENRAAADAEANKMAAEALGSVLYEFLSPKKQRIADTQSPSRVILPYIKSAKWVTEGKNNAQWVLEIPAEDMSPDLDTKSLQLAITDGLRSSGGPGRPYTRGYGDVQRIGRMYRIPITYSVMGY